MSGRGGGPPATRPAGSAPSLRLNLLSKPPSQQQPQQQQQPSGGGGGGGNGSDAAAKPTKKRRFTATPPPSSSPVVAAAADLQVLHQQTFLSLLLNRRQQRRQQATTSYSNSSSSWHVRGQTTLYVIDHAAPIQDARPSAPPQRQVALHLRGSCHVNKVKVETLAISNSTPTTTTNNTSTTTQEPFSTCPSRFQHYDPLTHVLTKPATSYTVEDDVLPTTKPRRYDADSQSTRGAAGMMSGLRVASIASNLGELRISMLLVQNNNNNHNQNNANSINTATTPKNSSEHHASNQLLAARREAAWKEDLLSLPTSSDRGNVYYELQEQLLQRSEERRDARATLVAQTLAMAGDAAFKIIIDYDMPLPSHHHIHHLGGLHAVADDTTPHVYTTCGMLGDHEGARCWIPCLDSASAKHRASHEICIMVTAPMRDGLSVVGLGEDFGVSDTLLHDDDILKDPMAKEELGKDHIDWVLELMTLANGEPQELAAIPAHPIMDHPSRPHLIPPDHSLPPRRIVPLDDILATHIWLSSSWTPLPARSLGFCVGPFTVVEDPEYFSVDQEGDTVNGSNTTTHDNDKEEEEDDDDAQQTREARQAAIAMARQNGEGIRQVYIAPLYERKFLHAKTASLILLPHTELNLAPLTRRQRDASKALKDIIVACTVGVPHRALSLMREVLAVPAYRTSSYTQVWIPNAVHGGVTSGALHACPEVLCNPFLGGAIMDSRLLPPVGYRLPFHQGGRVLQFIQARCAVRGWINAALPLGGSDDVGFGYLLTLIESFLMSLYERGHGGFGEGGAKNGVFYTKRYSAGCGLNSTALDFLPVHNMEDGDLDLVAGSVPLDDRNNENHLRSAVNGSESHTSAADEFAVRHVLCKDVVDVMERGNDADKFNWMGAHLSLSFLSSNASSSSSLGCGAVELLHPLRGMVYRTLKTELFRKVVEARTDLTVFVRLIRAAFSAAHLVDIGEKEVRLPQSKKASSHSNDEAQSKSTHTDLSGEPQPPFLLCVNELIKTKGLTHTLFTRALRLLAGRIRESRLLGTLTDVDPTALDPITKRPIVQPEGFPNSYVRGGSELYLRVGIHVEPSADKGGSQSVVSKGLQLQTYAEPVIPEKGIAFGGPVSYRVIENEGALREFVRNINPDGSRCDWGSIFLHAKPVSSSKAQTDASGAIDAAGKESGEAGDQKQSSNKRLMEGAAVDSVFTDSFIHGGGYQAIDLIRLTNLTPLLWVRVDPPGQFGGRISVFQPDACLSEQLFYDSDAGAQVDAVRALAERPVRIQGSVKVTTVYDVKVSELPVRVLGDCLRGTATLHNVLPHTPAVRAQAALSIGQWQNNKAPPSKDSVGEGTWVGVKILIQYFRERYFSNGLILPAKFSRVVVKYNEPDVRDSGAANEMAPVSSKAAEEELFQYLDTLVSNDEKAAALTSAEEVDIEEDEEYRVRSAVVTALASIRAKDGMTPYVVREFLRSLLDSEDVTQVQNLITPDDELALERHTYGKSSNFGLEQRKKLIGDPSCSLAYLSSILVADALLALCHVNVSPDSILDPATGKPVQSKTVHPIVPLLDVAQRWLDWELYREKIRIDGEMESQTGVGCIYQDTVAACAITALSSLAILRESTTDTVDPDAKPPENAGLDEESPQQDKKSLDPAAALYYMAIFDRESRHSDVIRAACAQAIACICCAADRFENESEPALGLLTALEFMLARIRDPGTSPGLRQTLALLMMDACTGKIASMQRVGAIGGRNELIVSGARFLNGPLGASHGGDNGSALLMTVNAIAHPAASAVNDGARRGLRLMTKAGHPRESATETTIVRVARFASDLWRTINGDCIEQTLVDGKMTTLPNYIANGVCAFDGILRCSLLSLQQWLWPKTCFALLQVQAWKSHEGTQRYKNLGAHLVMKTTDEEQEAAKEEEDSLADLKRMVAVELDRQRWRNDMAMKAYEYFKADKEGKTLVDLEQGVGYPLPPIQRDSSFRQGGWIASVAQQRRTLALDGGTAVTKLRLTVKNSGGDE